MTESYFETSGVLPSGRQVRFVLRPGYSSESIIQAALAFDRALTARGLAAYQDEREQRTVVDYVLRLNHTNADGTTTPVIAFYNDRLEYKICHEYLNTGDEARAFLDASGLLDLDSLPLCGGMTAPKRATPLFRQCARPPRQRFAVVTRKPEGETANGIAPKIELVRYEIVAPHPSETPPDGD